MQTSNDFPVTAMHRWRMWIPACLTLVSVVAMFLPEAIASVTRVPPLVVQGTGFVLFVAVVAAVACAARCVGCKRNLLFLSMGVEDASSWLERFVEMKSCPRCGYPKDPGD